MKFINLNRLYVSIYGFFQYKIIYQDREDIFIDMIDVEKNTPFSYFILDVEDILIFDSNFIVWKDKKNYLTKFK